MNEVDAFGLGFLILVVAVVLLCCSESDPNDRGT